jgi:hypothetical protein
MVDKELEKYYEGQFDLFTQPAWKDFLDDVGKLKDSLPTIKNVSGVEQLKFVQGQLDILDWILDRKNLFETAFKSLTENSED